jgi:GH15 family glucan-1,4-alpha-glucosidase
MPRELPISNGDLLVTFDSTYTARDLYYPYVGKYNHTVGHPQRFGVWADGQFAWMDDPAWARHLAYDECTLVTRVRLEHPRLQVRLDCADAIDFHEPVWLRKVTVTDTRAQPPQGQPALPPRDVRLFFHIDLSIQESPVGDTANYDPQTAGLVLYKGDYYFLVNGCDPAKCGIDHWSIGSKRIGNAEGTWRDAEDGQLGRNAIAQGSVDATIGFDLRIEPGGQASVHWWLACGRDYDTVARLNRTIYERTPDKFLSRTGAYWRLWATKEPIDLSTLPSPVAQAYTRSLLVTRTQIDNRGAIIAANDTDITHFAGDTYSYCWPRDGALVAASLIAAGNAALPRGFFRAAGEWINKHGYFLHKYTPDGKLASSWHPWHINGQSVLPIQQDETALVLWSLRKHFEAFRDVEFIKPLYNSLVITPAKWMVEYRDASGLPQPSWDLWEERRGVHTFTVAATIAALHAAGDFATDFGDLGRARWFTQAAEQMLAALKEHLWSAKEQRFARMGTRIVPGNTLAEPGAGAYSLDLTRDAANFALWWFGVLSPDDPMVVAEMESIESTLRVRTQVGGYARYENDYYHRVVFDDKNVPGNPWVICTLWIAQWKIARAKTHAELAPALELIEWAVATGGTSGIVPEQVHPLNGQPVSVAPLTWSHATIVIAIREYLTKLAVLK